MKFFFLLVLWAKLIQIVQSKDLKMLILVDYLFILPCSYWCDVYLKKVNFVRQNCGGIQSTMY